VLPVSSFHFRDHLSDATRISVTFHKTKGALLRLHTWYTFFILDIQHRRSVFLVNQHSIIKPHQLHEMRTRAIYDPRHRSVGRSVTWLHCAKTAEQFEALLWVDTLEEWRFHLDGSSDFPNKFDAAFTKLLWQFVLGVTTEQLVR